MNRKRIFFFRSLIVLSSIIGIIALAFGIVNFWPRSVEPPLWTAQDIFTPEDPATNAWNLLPEKGIEVPPSLEFEEGYNVVSSLFSPFLTSDTPLLSEKMAGFWEAVAEIKPLLSSAIQKENHFLSSYLRMVALPQMIDNSPIDSFFGHRSDFFFSTAHDIGCFHLIHLALQDRWDEAYDLWALILNKDLSLAKSARKLTTGWQAILLLKNDLNLLNLLLYKHPPADPKKIQESLRNLSPQELSLRRILIYEYLHTLWLADTFVQEQKQRGKTWVSLTFHRALVRQEINQKYRLYENFVHHPEMIPPDSSNVDGEGSHRLKRPFWWFVNMGGKRFQSVIESPMIYHIKKIYGERTRVSVLQQAMTQYLQGRDVKVMP